MTNEKRAERLRSLMQSRNYNAPALARAAGVTTQTVYNVLKGRGKGCSMTTLSKLADALGLSVKTLI